VLILLGATAAQTLLGAKFRVPKDRGKPITNIDWAPVVIATVHPSSILRAPDKSERRRQYQLFVSDLRVSAKSAEKLPG